MSPMHLPSWCQTTGYRKSNRAIGVYWEVLGATLVLGPDDPVALFGSPDVAPDVDRLLASSRAPIERFASVVAIVKFNLPLSDGELPGRYHPSRREKGLDGCVVLDEVDAFADSRLLVHAMALHRATALACGMRPLPLEIHMARLVLRGMDCDLPPLATAQVDAAGQVRCIQMA